MPLTLKEIQLQDLKGVQVKIQIQNYKKYEQNKSQFVQSVNLCKNVNKTCVKSHNFEIYHLINELLPGNFVEIKISLHVHENSEISNYGKDISFRFVLITENEEYNFEIVAKYYRGSLELLPKKVNYNLIYPFASELITVSALSSFDEKLSVDIPNKKGPGSSMIDIITFNRILDEGLKENFLQFKIDTDLIGYPEEHMIN